MSVFFAAPPAHAEKRVALVIGNAAYQHADKLANPVTDARRLRDTLAKLGFEIVFGEDLAKQQVERAIGRFANVAQDADVALVYFAGHGTTLGDMPYVVPVDAQFSRLEEMPYELVSVETLIGELRRAKGLRIAILDACRDNAAERELKRVAARGGEITRGLARVKHPEGLIIAYAAQYMSTAADGDPNGDSPFTAALLNNIATPGLDVKELFFRVGGEVIANTKGMQQPEISVSFFGSYSLVSAGSGAAVTPPIASAAPDPAERAWAAVKDTTSQLVLEDFIRRYGGSIYETLARARLDELRKNQMAAANPYIQSEPQSAVKKALGLDLAGLNTALRSKYKVVDRIKGVVIVGVDSDSPANDKHLALGDVIVEVAEEAVAGADEVQAKIERLKRDGRRSALLLVANPDGELRFVALPLKPDAAISGAPGPSTDTVAALRGKVIETVVSIVRAKPPQSQSTGQSPPPQSPNAPFDELFRDFFNRQEDLRVREDELIGSGFITDASGIVVTNNHVIADAGDEIAVILNDGTRLKAELIAKDAKTDLALLRIRTDKSLKAARFGDSEKLNLSERIFAVGNPLSQGAGTIREGAVLARSRAPGSSAYDPYTQTNLLTNRENSGGPLFNLDGEVVGINTAIISRSTGSIGTGFSVPSRTAVPVIDQLRQFGETRRGWLGVRIQPVTDEIAASLHIKPPHGALVAGIDEKGPAKPAGIEAGDVVVKIDGKDIKEMGDLPRVVADTPVGKAVEVVIIRKGEQVTKTVTLGRLEDGEKQMAEAETEAQPDQKMAVKKTLGLDLANLDGTLRSKYKVKASVKGVVIVGVDADSVANAQRLSPGDVIVEVAQQAVVSADDCQAKIDKLKRDGRSSALLLVANPAGDLRFIALPLKPVALVPETRQEQRPTNKKTAQPRPRGPQ
jgi:serine protease Do